MFRRKIQHVSANASEVLPASSSNSLYNRTTLSTTAPMERVIPRPTVRTNTIQGKNVNSNENPMSKQSLVPINKSFNNCTLSSAKAVNRNFRRPTQNRASVNKHAHGNPFKRSEVGQSTGTSRNPTKQSRIPSRRGVNRRQGAESNSPNNCKTIHLSRLDPSDLVLKLIEAETWFSETLQQPSLEDDSVAEIVKLIDKCMESHMHNECQNRLVIMILTSGFFETKVPEYMSYFADRPSNLNSFVLTLIKVFHTLLSRMPMLASEELKTCITKCRIWMSDYIHTSEEVSIWQKKLEKVEDRLDDIQHPQQHTDVEKSYSFSGAATNAENLDDYRNVPVIPEISEIVCAQRPKLEKNIVSGKFSSVKDYLDTHFRLLREDYIAPLREGICEFLSQERGRNRKFRFQDVRLYQNVQITEVVLKPNGGIVYKLQFDLRHFNTRQSGSSHKLIYGSLLCLSHDCFRTIRFATVEDSDLQMLRNGIITVAFVDEKDDGSNLKKTYMMAVSPAFFEAYRHILQGLKSMDPETMPFQRYLVGVKTDMRTPNYIWNRRVLDISFLGEEAKKFNKVVVNNLSSWPAASELGLDDSQRRAMQVALSNAIGIVQGPPGTGKTFVGLKVVQALLQNALLKTPILVVCLTNHALDQFLEGMLPFTDKMVRVGSRSKNEDLNPYSLRNAVYEKKKVSSSISLRLNAVDEKSRQIRDQIIDLQFKLKTRYFYILHEDNLEDLPEPDASLVKELCRNFNYNHSLKNSALFSWLGLLLDDAVCESDIQTFLRNEETTNTPNEETEETIRDAGTEKDLIDLEDENTVETKHRNLDLDYASFDDKRGQTRININEVTEGRLSIGLLNNPYYAYNMEPYSGNVESIEDGTVRNDHMYIRKNYYALEDQLIDLQRIAEGEVRKNSEMRHDELHHFQLWSMPLAHRWRLYRRWVNLHDKPLEDNMKEQLQMFKEKCKIKQELIAQMEYGILKQSKVIGMTTTGAAKYQATLHEIGCKAVIIEEAAEVLESHVIALLNPKTEHLILIGDHQQLKPKPTTYYLAKEFKLDVSLFERLVRNNLPYVTLQQQHRMRPEISQLIRKHIYPNLEDHISVQDYPAILGLQHSVFFLNHSHQEKEFHSDSKTHVNIFEAEFVVGLCRYLLQQGYEKTKITILAGYMGQALEIGQRMPKVEFEGVRVTVIDNYQGEENDIIILSLVRSNDEGNVGFMRIDNRVNVALSRAKRGLYAVGNLNLFSDSSSFWRGLMVDLEKQKLTGTDLPLMCQTHTDTISLVSTVEQFSQFAPDGGCLLECTDLLDCGHQCSKFCHAGEHGTCQEPCTKSCVEGHTCPLKCGQECSDCFTTVRRTLPRCGHSRNARCSENIILLKCIEACIYRVDCGHMCSQKCHTAIQFQGQHVSNPCEQKCDKIICKVHINQKCSKICKDECSVCPVKIESILPCGHACKVECGLLNQEICKEPCGKILSCGHKCTRICGVDCSPCKVLVDKCLPCGHAMEVPCALKGCIFIKSTPLSRKENNKSNVYCLTSLLGLLEEQYLTQLFDSGGKMWSRKIFMCEKNCDKILSCGHICQAPCSSACTENCEVEVPVKGDCTHVILLPCHLAKLPTGSMTSIYEYCKQPCATILPCGHVCIGTCGDCFEGRVHVPCDKKCQRVQICGHACDMTCSEICPPCNKNCSNRCEHGKCPSKCGQSCKPCKERCEWKCGHQRCTNHCEEECNRPPCDEPCLELLRCQHPCVGLCGEVCPKLCPICKPEEFPEHHLEHEPKARFVMLEDCRHCIEVTVMDQWMNKNLETVGMKCCPKCMATIWRSQRYGNIIRRRIKDVQEVKMEISSNKGKRRDKMSALYDKLKSHHQYSHISERFPEAFKSLEVRLRQKTTLDYGACSITENQILLLNAMSMLWDFPETLVHKEVADYIRQQTERLAARLMKYEYKLVQQDFENISRECRRINLQASLIAIRKKKISSNKFWSRENLDKLIQIEQLLTGTSLGDDQENEMKRTLRSFQQLEGIGIMEHDRVMIIEAMDNGQKGHWFKCPNGHFFENHSEILRGLKCIKCGAIIDGIERCT